jgi:NAD(P)-dependent dehydrogenase (short-subunit alcohol dehydrogenase family)
MELEGKVALVIGAPRGMGKATVLKFAGLGSEPAASYMAI